MTTALEIFDKIKRADYHVPHKFDGRPFLSLPSPAGCTTFCDIGYDQERIVAALVAAHLSSGQGDVTLYVPNKNAVAAYLIYIARCFKDMPDLGHVVHFDRTRTIKIATTAGFAQVFVYKLCEKNLRETGSTGLIAILDPNEAHEQLVRKIITAQVSTVNYKTVVVNGKSEPFADLLDVERTEQVEESLRLLRINEK